MERSEALEVLGLSGSQDVQAVLEAYYSRKDGLRLEYGNPPPDHLRAECRLKLAVIREARDLLVPRYIESADAPQSPVATPPGVSVEGGRMALKVGQVLCERYEIRSFLGAGGMGAVYVAYDRMRSEDIAIKVLLPRLLKKQDARERFLNEARLASSLSHPNIVNVFDVQQEADFYFLTMEYLKGRSLREAIEARAEGERRWAVDDVLTLAQTLCDALSYAHKYTVHRDLKPENIFLCDGGTAKLLDFGLARVLSISQLTQSGIAMGTAYYIAPEQLRGSKVIDVQADQFSLAVVLYELLTGSLPVGRVKSASEVRHDVPEALSRTLDRALEPDPQARFTDIEDMAATLSYPSEGTEEKAKTPKSSRNRRGLYWMAAAAVVLVMLASAGVWSAPWLNTQLENWRAQSSIRENLVAEAREEAEIAETDAEFAGAKQNADETWVQAQDQLQLARQLEGTGDLDQAMEAYRGAQDILETAEKKAYELRQKVDPVRDVVRRAERVEAIARAYDAARAGETEWEIASASHDLAETAYREQRYEDSYSLFKRTRDDYQHAIEASESLGADRVSTLRTLVEQAQLEVGTPEVLSYALDEVNSAKDFIRQAAKTPDNYETAAELYRQALDKFKRAEIEGPRRAKAAQEGADVARKDALQAKNDLGPKERSLAESEADSGDWAWKEAEEAYGNGAFGDAKPEYVHARQRYAYALKVARDRRETPQVENSATTNSNTRSVAKLKGNLSVSPGTLSIDGEDSSVSAKVLIGEKPAPPSQYTVKFKGDYGWMFTARTRQGAVSFQPRAERAEEGTYQVIVSAVGQSRVIKLVYKTVQSNCGKYQGMQAHLRDLGSHKLNTTFTQELGGPRELHYVWSYNGKVVARGDGKLSVTVKLGSTGRFTLKVEAMCEGQVMFSTTGTGTVY